ncbi:tetratricopeptide repeat protein [Sulfurimonas sp. C5]|uniref:tetratricopeptide repeat protein n=1 Tax=Sulfurimonas sp. C5 TaxID=3036947 RepID=UPI0024557843|nr:tetratricopeptide repeat protein [Sulfurimonas sp. C5]MDH4943959.1 tetratricopeptide repeat protein [Sulfurimonas sp. C5]
MYQYQPLSNEKYLEYLIRDLLSIEFINYSPFDLYGSRGQEQYGNDIIGYNTSGRMILAQVKKKSLSRNKIKEALLNDLTKETKSIINYFQTDKIDTIFFASTHGRDKDIQDKALKLTQEYGVKIIYWGWDTIEEKISHSNEIQKKYFHKKTTTLLTILPENSYCIGRENEFNEIKTLLNKDNIINIQSIGGIGKSTLANAFIHSERENYDYIGYISVDDSLEEAFFRSFNNFFNFSENDDLESIIYKLQSLNGKKILIIDNLTYQKDIVYIKKITSSFKVVITSRILFNDIPSLKLRQLNDNSLKELFNKYNDEDIEEQYLNELFKYLDYHTLFIELTSKTINQNNFTIDYILNEFRDGKFPIIKVDTNLDTYQEEIYNDYLRKLFEESIEKLDDGLFNGLILLSLFPSINLHVDEIGRVFNADLRNDLSLLSKKGWLISIEKEVFKIHQIIKEFFLFNFPLVAEDVTPMIKYYLENLKWNEIDHPSEQKSYMIFVQSLIDGLKSYDEEVMTLANNIAMLYRYFGFYEIALKYMLMVKDFDEESGNKMNLAQTYNNLAQVYFSMKQYELGEQYAMLSLKLREENSPYNIQENYLNMCNSYIRQSNYKEAKVYLDKLLTLEVDIRSIIPIYNSAMLYYLNIENTKEAFKYAEQALEHINSNKVDTKHLYIAYTYSNIADIYVEDKNITLAIEYKLKAKEHILENFGDQHPDLEPIENILNILQYIFKTEYL